MKTTIYLRKDRPNERGLYQVYFRVSEGQNRRFLPLKILVSEKHWDDAKALVKSSDSAYMNKNKIIIHAKQKADQIKTDAYLRNEDLTVEAFLKYYTSAIGSNNDFYTYVLNRLEANYKKNLIAHETYRTNKSQLSKLKQFRPNVQFKDLTKELFDQYKEYMLLELKNKPSTVNKSLTIIKEFCNWAKEDQLLKENPLSNLKREHYIGERDFLELHEVEKLLKIYHSGVFTEGKQKTLKSFLLSCFTGLRYQDIKTLNSDNIICTISDNKKKYYIKKVQNKLKKRNGAIVEIPLVKSAIDLLDIENLNIGVLLNTLTNQPTNRYLKEIAIHAGINKRLTFHVARYTFGSICLNNGMDIGFVSKLLGHSNINTSYQVYTKANIDMKFKQMDKVEANFKFSLETH